MNASQEAECLIRKYNPRLADIFNAHIFNRRLIAKAFKAGFSTDDGKRYAELVEKLAQLDFLERKLELA